MLGPVKYTSPGCKDGVKGVYRVELGEFVFARVLSRPQVGQALSRLDASSSSCDKLRIKS